MRRFFYLVLAFTAVPAKSRVRNAKELRCTLNSSMNTTMLTDEEKPQVNLQKTILLASDVPENCRNGVPVMLGIDEAGRGPVMGPMVYGAAFWPVTENDAMSALGFDDSKALTAENREGLFAKMKANSELG